MAKLPKKSKYPQRRPNASKKQQRQRSAPFLKRKKKTTRKKSRSTSSESLSFDTWGSSNSPENLKLLVQPMSQLKKPKKPHWMDKLKRKTLKLLN